MSDQILHGLLAVLTDEAERRAGAELATTLGRPVSQAEARAYRQTKRMPPAARPARSRESGPALRLDRRVALKAAARTLAARGITGPDIDWR